MLLEINYNIQNIVKFKNLMQVAINQPKSKAFNIFLRMLQLGGQLILGYWATKFGGTQSCDYTIPNIVSYISYALAGLNFLAVVYVRCVSKFPRLFFFALFLLDLGMAAAIIGLMFARGFYNCAATKVFYQFSIIQSIIGIVVSFVILIMRLAWQQRYTNSPGNIVWAPLFLANQWTDAYRIPMMIIGIAAAFVSVMTLLVNLATCVKTSTSTRKLVMGAWGLGVFILIALEALALVKYFTSGSASQYSDVQARKTLQVFIVVNAWDILFWLWGYKSFDYQKGDHVRQDLFSGKQQFNTNRYTRGQNLQKSVVVSNNIGTIHH